MTMKQRPVKWSSYRICTHFTSLCNLVFGILLISMWAACYQRCLSRFDSENDAAAPLWTGIMCVIVGSFGMIASWLYWRRKNEALLFVLTLIILLCSMAALPLSVYASFREFQLYQSQGRPLDVFDYGILGVVLFASMAFFSFMVFLASVTWACTCAFKRYKARSNDEQRYRDEDSDEIQMERQEEEETPAFVRAFQTASLPRATTRFAAPAAVHPLQQATSYDRRPNNVPGPAYPQVSFNLPKFSSWDPKRKVPRHSPSGPRFASVTVAEQQWWRYCNPYEERTRRVSGL